jgi:glycosyltransferase involved in cell wall biosynthesis
MRIALVHDWLTGLRGGEKCLEVACRHFPEAPLFTLLHAPGSTSPVIERMDIRPSLLQKLPLVARYYRYCLPAMPWAIERLRVPDDVDLVLSFSHAVAKGIRVPAGMPHVCYCYTPMRYAWELREQYFAGSGWRRGGMLRLIPSPARLARDWVLDGIRAWDRRSSDRVTHFIAISSTIAHRIQAAYGRTSTIIYPPVDTHFYTPASVPREDFYLCVSALVPYKRIELAVQACNQSRRKLLIIGSGPQRKHLARLAGPNVTLLGWQPDEVIRDHYRRCRALLFPGLEDFGIVPVEAQACGAPVIAFGQGGATETTVAANEHSPASSVLFEEQTVESLLGAIDWFERHPRQFAPELARKSAERFTLQRYERDLLGFLYQAAGRCRRAA